MERNYMLAPAVATFGRTLWNNLVIGYRISTLDSEDYNDNYKRLTPKEQMRGTCEFQYKDIAKVTVVETNNIRISADTSEGLEFAESALKSICEAKGCPLVDLN